MDLDKSLEEAWRALIVEGEPKKTAVWALKKRLKEVRRALMQQRADQVYAELTVAAGERVLKEYEE